MVHHALAVSFLVLRFYSTRNHTSDDRMEVVVSLAAIVLQQAALFEIEDGFSQLLRGSLKRRRAIPTDRKSVV